MIAESMESMDIKPHSHLLAKAKFSYGRRVPKTYNENAQKQVPAIKSGEVFRTECGKFSFVCTYCGSVWRNCDLMMIHVNSHFKPKQQNIETSTTLLASPEFVSIGEVKTEPGLDVDTAIVPIENTVHREQTSTIIRPSVSKSTPKQLNSMENSKLPPTTRSLEKDGQPTIGSNVSKSTTQVPNTAHLSKLPPTTRLVRIVKRTNDLSVAMALLKTENNEATNSGDKSTPFRTRRILKVVKRNHSTDDSTSTAILKLKRIEQNPSRIAAKTEPSAIVDLTSDLHVPGKIENNERTSAISVKSIISLAQPQPNVESINGQDSKSKRKVCLRRSCYQCEMEPKVHRPCDPRRHKCLYCPVWFPNHDEFYLHVRDVHEKDPAFVACQYYYCYACEKRFTFRQHLAAHVNSHLETAEAHLCAVCGSSFTTKKKFMAHMENHMERKFKCDRCGKAFKQLWILRQHLLCHSKCSSEYVCEICSKAFKFGKYLKRHMAVHDEPKITCRHCDAKFHFSSVRRAHEQTRHQVV